MSAAHLFQDEIDPTNIDLLLDTQTDLNTSFADIENNINLLQALGLAGDLTINGSREDVVVLRRIDGQQTTARINLTSANFLSGPYQMIKPNDVIVVNPNSAKLKTAGYVGNISAILGITSVILTTILLFTR